MGSVIGDHKVVFGKGKEGRVLFADIGAQRGTRCVALLTATRVGEAEAYSGHVILSDEEGARSPEAFPVSFSVEAGKDEAAMAAVITACAHVSDRLIMPGWDGHEKALVTSTTDLTAYVRDFAGQDGAEKRSDPRVIRTGLKAKLFRAPTNDKASKERRIITPAPSSIGVAVGDPAPAFEAAEAARRAAGPAQKVGGAPLMAPKLDLEAAKAALSAVWAPSVAASDYFGAAGLPEGDVRAGDRAQAARSYPVLAGMIAANEEMRRAVDERAALLPIVMDHTGLSKGALKRLSKVKAPFDEGAVMGDEAVVLMVDQLGVNRRTGNVVRGVLSLPQALEHLKELPPEWVPDTDEGWRAFADILGGLAVPLAPATGRSVKDLLSSSKGDWVGFRATLAKAADVPAETFDRHQMAGIAGEIIGMFDSFARTAVMPMLANVLRRAEQLTLVQRSPEIVDAATDQSMLAAANVIIGRAKNPLAALLEAERRYISRDTAITGLSRGVGEAAQNLEPQDAQFGDLVGNKAFPVLRETWTASNGYEVVPFRNEAEMAAEGALMGHCVGGHHRNYGSSGEYHYFSVRNPATMNDPKQRGTLRLMPVSPGGSIEIGEFRSHHNSDTNAACKLAYKEWKASFLQKDLDEAGARMDQWREWRRARGLQAGNRVRSPEEIWVGKTGVNVESTQTAEALWAEWAGNVLSGWPADNPEVLFRDAGVRDVLTNLSATAADFLKEEAAARKAAENDAGAPSP